MLSNRFEKSTMGWRLITVLLVFGMLMSGIPASAMMFEDIGSNDMPLTEIVKEDVYETITYNYSFKTPSISEEGGFDHVQLGEEASLLTSDPGKPLIPYIPLKILLSAGKEVISVEVSAQGETVLGQDYDLDWAKEPMILLFGDEMQTMSAPLSTRDEAVYSSTSPFPGNFHEEISVQYFRGYPILYINLFPVQYIPSDGSLYYYEGIDVTIRTTDAELSPLFRDLDTDREELLKKVDNPELISTYDTYSIGLEPLATWDMVIITNNALNNSAGAYTFQDLATFRSSHGIATTIKTVEDIYASYSGVDDSEKIRNFIIDAYTNWGVDYVLLGGDGDGGDVGGESGDNIVPARLLYCAPTFGYTDVLASDLYYACLDGDFNNDGDSYWGETNDGVGGGDVDIMAEVFVGRAPVDSDSELSNFVRKTIEYETSTSDALETVYFLGEYLGFGGVADWGGNYKDQIMDANGSSYAGYTTLGVPDDYIKTSLYERDGGWTDTNLENAMNTGLNFINHLGHAYNGEVMKITCSEADVLTNSEPFFAYSQGCYCGAFDNRDAPPPYGSGGYLNYDAVGEHLVTAQYGAFAVIMNSRFGWGAGDLDGPSQRLDREFFDAIYGEGISAIGAANHDSKEDCISVINGYDNLIRWCIYETNLLGDPAVRMKGAQCDHDVGIASINNPSEGATIIPAPTTINVSVMNYGLNSETFDIQCTISDVAIAQPTAVVYSATETVIELMPGELRDFEFLSTWNAGVCGDYIMEVSTLLAGDEDTNNNMQSPTFTVADIHDVGVASIDSPGIGEVYPTGILDIDATVENYGSLTETFSANYTIWDLDVVSTPILTDDFETDAPGWTGIGRETGIISNVAIFQTQNPWGMTSNQDILDINGIPYTIFSTADIGSISLAPYDKVIIAGSGGQSGTFYTAIANNKAWFENYAAGGGNLEIHITDSGFNTIPGNFVSVYNPGDAVDIAIPGHETLINPNVITDGELDGWNSAYHRYFTSWPSGSDLILTSASNGYPVLIDSPWGAGHIVVSGQTLEWAWGHGYSLIPENIILYSSSGGTSWELGTPVFGNITNAHSGVNCWGTNLSANYLPDTNINLISPSFDLSTGTSNERLGFWQTHDFYNTEAGGIVEISIDPGHITWTQIDPISGDAHYGASAAFGGGNAFTGDAYVDWYQSIFDLSPYSDNNDVQIRFVFRSTSDATTNEGWFIDDLEITGEIIGLNNIIAWGEETVTGLAPFAIMQKQVFGDNVYIASEGEYFIEVETSLIGDEVPSNDKTSGYFTVDDIHDVAATSINYPTGNSDISQGEHVVNATIENTGTNTETFNVKCTIRNSSSTVVYTDSETVINMAYDDIIFIEFSPAWNVAIDDDYDIEVITQLAGDEDGSNDMASTSVTVNDIHDVGIVSVNSPVIGGLYPTGPLEINATIENYGNVPDTFIANYTIWNLSVMPNQVLSEDFESGAPGWNITAATGSTFGDVSSIGDFSFGVGSFTVINAITAPVGGTITEFRTYCGANNLVKFKVFRNTGGNSFTLVGESAVVNSGAGLQTHATSITGVQAGDYGGLWYDESGGSVHLMAGMESWWYQFGDIGSASFSSFGSGMNAVFDASFSGGTSWELGSPSNGDITSAHNGTDCTGTGLTMDYLPDTETDITSPSFDLSNGTSNELLSFWHTHDFYNTEAGGVVEVSVDLAHAVWTQIDPISGDAYYGSSNAFGSGDAFTSDPYANWYQSTFDLSPFSGNDDVQIRFTFRSTSDVTTNEGWFIDDVEVWGYNIGPSSIIAWGDEMVTGLEPFSQKVVFGSTVDLLSEEDYYIEVKTLLAGDEDTSNDMVSGYFTIDDISDVGIASINSPANGSVYPTWPVEINATVDNYGNVPNTFMVNYTLGNYTVVTNTLLSDDFESGAPGWITDSSGNGFSDDMESGIGDWTHSQIAGSAGDNWDQSNVRSNSSATSWHSGVEPGANWGDSVLVTPVIDLSGVTDTRLTFWHWYHFYESFPIDGGIVEVFDGGSWTQVMPSGGYDDALAVGWQNPIEGSLAFTYSSGGWDFEDFDLSAYDGMTIQVRFHVGWNSINDGITEGWYIDDVAIGGIGGGTVYELGNPTFGDINSAYSGANCWGTNLTDNYLPDSSTGLTSPSFDLSNGTSNELLTFWHSHDFYNTEAGGIVEITTDNSTWTKIEPINGNTWYSASNAFTGDDAFTGDTYRDWYQSTYDLSPFSGNNDVRVRFVFKSTPDPTCHEGWYVDDVLITGDILTPDTVLDTGDELIGLLPGEQKFVFGNTYNFTEEGSYWLNVETRLANDEDDTNNLTTSMFTIYNYDDVGIVSIDPFADGEVYPNGTYDISATIRNHGNYYASGFSVDCVIRDSAAGIVYSSTYNVNSTMNPGDELNITFPSWVVPTEDDYSIEVITNYSIDESNINDGIDIDITIDDIHDVGVISISPLVDGDIYTLGVYPIELRVQNFGNINQSASAFDIYCQIINSDGIAVYNEVFASPELLGPGEYLDITFPSWNAIIEDTYLINAFTALSTDEYNMNNATAISVMIDDIHDVSVTSINSHSDGEMYPTGTHMVTATISNMGNVPVSDFIVYCQIIDPMGTQVYYCESGIPGGLLPGDSIDTFFTPYWEALVEDDHTIIVSTMLVGDEQVSNDAYSVDISIMNIYDIGVTAINSLLNGAVYPTGSYQINVTVENFGNVPISGFEEIYLTIYDSSFMEVHTAITMVGEGLLPGEAKEITISDWNVNIEDVYTLYATTILANDENNMNNDTTISIEIDEPYDASLISIDTFTDGGTYTRGTYTLNATVSNTGTIDISDLDVECTIWDSSGVMVFNDLQVIPFMQSNDVIVVSFSPDWFAGIEDTYTILVETQLPGDENVANDQSLTLIEINDIYDMKAMSIGPFIDGGKYSSGSYTIEGMVMNNGNVPVSDFKVQLMVMDSNDVLVYFSEVTVSVPLLSGDSMLITFTPDWTVSGNDTYTIQLSTILQGDEEPLDDKTSISVEIMSYHDIALLDSSPFEDGASYHTGTYPLEATISNLGTFTETNIIVNCTIYDSLNTAIYTGSVIVGSLTPGSDTTVVFSPFWNAGIEGDYDIDITIYLPTDEDNTNDQILIDITIDDAHDICITDSTPFIDGSIYPTGIYMINTTVENIGSVTESNIPVNCTIRDSSGNIVYTSEYIILTLDEGESMVITFTPSWDVLVEDDYSISITTQLAIDENNGNDQILLNVIIDESHDISVISSAPFTDLGLYPIGTYTLDIAIENLGSVSESGIELACIIVDSNNDVIFRANTTISSISVGEVIPVTISPDWDVLDDGSYTLFVIVDMATDDNPDNDCLTTLFYIDATPPIADAGQDDWTYEDDIYYFNGTGSFDVQGIVNYTWDFGDGSFGYGPIPSHSYTLQDNYTVTLTVTDDMGNSDVDTLNISVLNKPPVADAGDDQTVSEGTTVIFDGSNTTDTLSDISTLVYTWWFGDGSTGTGISPSHVYSSPGTYMVTVLVQDDDGDSDLAYLNITVIDAPPVSVIGGPYSGIEGELIEFNASSSTEPGDNIVLYEWDWDNDGIYDEASANPSAYNSWFTPGTYTIWLRVTDEDGSNSTAMADVIVSDAAPVAILNGSYSGDEGTTIAFDAGDSTEPGDDIVLYQWDWDDDGVYDYTSSTPTASHTWYTAGACTINLMVTDIDGSTGTTSTLVNVNDIAPIAILDSNIYNENEGTYIIFDASDSSEPGDDIVLYEWDWDNDGIYDEASGIAISTHTWYSPGIYTISLRVTDEDGSMHSTGANVIIADVAPSANPSGPYNGDEGSAIIFDASASTEPGDDIVLYEWDWNNDGIYDHTSSTPTSTYTWYKAASQSIRLRVTDEDGSQSIMTATVNILDIAPIAIASGPYLGEEGKTVAFNAGASTEPGNDIVLYEWDWDNDGIYDSVSASPTATHSWDNAGIHTIRLKVTDEDGSSHVAITDVDIADIAPEAIVSGMPSGDEGATVLFDASDSREPGDDIILYEWDWDNDGVYDEASGIATSAHTWYSPGIYTISLRVTDEDGSMHSTGANVIIADVAPSANPSGPYNGDEGSAIIFDASASIEPGDNIVLYEWDWNNDGVYDHTSSTPTSTYTWYKAASHSIRLRVTDEDGSSHISTTSVYIEDVAPRAIINGASSVDEGVAMFFNASDSSEPGDDIILYEWDWDNDGVYDEALNTPESLHTWYSPGIQTLSLRVTDEEGSYSITVYSVTVEDISPMANIVGPDNGTEGDVIFFDAGRSTEPGDDIVLYEWDLDNDGVYESSSADPIISITWYSEGYRTIGLRVVDEDGSSSYSTKVVNIKDVAPIAVPGGPYTVDEGTILYLDASDSIEPGDNIVLYEWDCDNDGVYDSTITTPMTIYKWEKEGIYEVTLRVTDEDGSSSISTIAVNVNSVRDMDGDGYLDIWEEFLGTDHTDFADTPLDTDKDGKPNGDDMNSEPWMDMDDDDDGILDDDDLEPMNTLEESPFLNYWWLIIIILILTALIIMMFFYNNRVGSEPPENDDIVEEDENDEVETDNGSSLGASEGPTVESSDKTEPAKPEKTTTSTNGIGMNNGDKIARLEKAFLEGKISEENYQSNLGRFKN